MPLPRLRRAPRTPTADDDDWGTSSPAAIMDNPSVPPVPQRMPMSTFARLQQQELTSYICTFSPRSVIFLYFLIAIVFIPLGAALAAGSSRVHSTPLCLYSKENTDANDDTSCQAVEGRSNTFRFKIDQDIPSPSYLYYHFTKYYQNARQYAKSRSDVMNRGVVPSAPIEVSACSPWLYRKGEEAGETFDPLKFYYPCGLTTRSFFNDTFKLCRGELGGCVTLSPKGIALKTDSEVKFRPGGGKPFQDQSFSGIPHSSETPHELLKDERFIVWMRLSAFPTFNKLYAIIEEDLRAGTYFMDIEDNYDISTLDSDKGFFISTATWFGSPNSFLAAAYLFVGIISLLIASVLLFKHVISPRSTSSTDPAILLKQHLEKLDMDVSQAMQNEY